MCYILDSKNCLEYAGFSCLILFVTPVMKHCTTESGGENSVCSSAHRFTVGLSSGLLVP